MKYYFQAGTIVLMFYQFLGGAIYHMTSSSHGYELGFVPPLLLTGFPAQSLCGFWNPTFLKFLHTGTGWGPIDRKGKPISKR